MPPKTFHAPLIASVPGLSLTAVASSNASKVHADWPSIEVCDSPGALIAREDVDLVVVPTPNDTHFPLARDALTAGKHVVGRAQARGCGPTWARISSINACSSSVCPLP